jgi:hypothetical protein
MGSISLKYKSKSGNLTAPGDVDPGAMVPIATVSVSAGGASYVEFTSIPGYYQHLQIRGMGRTNRSANGDYALISVNGDTSTSNYTTHYMQGNGSAISAGSYIQSFAGALMSRWAAASDGANIFGVGILDIFDYSNASKYKVFRDISGLQTATSNSQINLESSTWLSNTAITSLRISPGAGTSWNQYTTFALYGIKRAGA